MKPILQLILTCKIQLHPKILLKNAGLSYYLVLFEWLLWIVTVFFMNGPITAIN